MTNIKDNLLCDLEQLMYMKCHATNYLDKINNLFDVIKEKIESMPDEPAFDPAKEYTFQEAAQLAFENPGWVFYTKCTGRQIADYTRGFYHKDGDAGNYYSITHNNEINKYDDFFAPAPEDFTAVWHRTK